MMYWDVLNGRGFLPSEDPLTALFVPERWVTVAFHLETLHYALPRYTEEGIARARIESTLAMMDLNGLVEDLDEQNLHRLHHILEYFESLAPGSCGAALVLVCRNLGFVPDPYYSRCLANWRRTRSNMAVHYNNVQRLTPFSSGDWVNLHIDMEFRAVEALKLLATVFSKTPPAKMLGMVKQAVSAMTWSVDHALASLDVFGPNRDGACFAIRAIGRVLDPSSDLPGETGLCEEHAKLFRRARKVGQVLQEHAEGDIAGLLEQCRTTWDELHRKYVSIGVDKTGNVGGATNVQEFQGLADG